MRPFTVLAYVSPLLWLSQCLPVMAAPIPKENPKKTSVLTAEQFARKLASEGQRTQFLPVIAKLVDLDPDVENRILSLEASRTTDGWGRLARVILQPTGPEGAMEPASLFWSLELEADGRKESYNYRSAVDGTLEKAARLDGRLDRDGKPIRGSGSVTHLDVGSAEVREMFRDRVLGFWLKGKYRAKARRK